MPLALEMWLDADLQRPNVSTGVDIEPPAPVDRALRPPPVGFEDAAAAEGRQGDAEGGIEEEGALDASRTSMRIPYALCVGMCLTVVAPAAAQPPLAGLAMSRFPGFHVMLSRP
jgi:hypothetical protein